VSDTTTFAWLTLLTAGVGLLALLSNRLTERIKVPAPLLVLVAAALTVNSIGDLHRPPERLVERLVTVALVCILFDGGQQMGWSRFRTAAGPIVITGVLGTFLTTAAAAAFIHFAFGLNWYLALLVATAISPTDPAVVFSVLGQREVQGRSGTILEGESGANDPVGIALMASLIAAGGLDTSAFGQITGQFLLQLGVGGAVGVLGGWLLLRFVRTVPLPSEGLYPLRSLACVFLLFGLATLAHGSGFLAVFVAGILTGDERVPYKREVERFHTALASLGEIVAFTVLGLTVDLHQLGRAEVWVPGLVIGAVLAVVIRPIAVWLCLIPAGLRSNERAFVLFAGLKGAVPILLGGFILAAHVEQADRLYGIVIIVVGFSVLVQGSLVPAVAGRLRLPMRTRSPEPWALGVRLAEEPDGVHRLTVAPGAAADGRRIDDLPGFPESAWISLIVRNNQPIPVRSDSTLQAGDQLIITGATDLTAGLKAIFTESTR
jgi:cell volume regulation protein A